MNQADLTDMHRTPPTLFSGVLGKFSRVDHILDLKVSLKTFKITVTIKVYSLSTMN